jgi:predicted RNA-binding protein with EMAP domain
MKDEVKLILALQQINNLTDLLQGNEYRTFLYGHLISIKCELERQLTNIQYTDKIKE